MVPTDTPTPTPAACVLVPIRARSLNQRTHWSVKRKQRQTVAWCFAGKTPPAGPVLVTLCRIAPSGGLDAHDNLPGSLKPSVDGVADWLKRDDADPSITWKYEQERGKLYGVRITVEVRHE